MTKYTNHTSRALLTILMIVSTQVSYAADLHPIVLTSINGGEKWSIQSNIDSFPSDGLLNGIDCLGNVCITVGQTERQNGKRKPLLLVSNDFGKTWSRKDNIIALPSIDEGGLDSSFCVDNICATVGWFSNATNKGLPLILVSNDKSQTWNYIKPQLPEGIRFGYLDDITHVANSWISVGYYSNKYVPGSDSERPLVLISRDKGGSWFSTENINGLPKATNMRLTSVKCSMNTCIAVGTYSTGGVDSHTLILVSKDVGLSWNFIKEIPGLANMESLFVEGLDFINDSFIAVGGYKQYRGGRENMNPLILKSNDDGQTWSLIKNITGTVPNEVFGWLSSITCTENACLASWGTLSAPYLPLFTSADAGQSWLIKSAVSGAILNPRINAMQCSGLSCMAVGDYWQ